MSARLSPQREAEIGARAGHLYEYSTSHDIEWDALAGEDVPALLAELAATREELAGQKRATERWRERAEKAEERLSAVLDICDREQRNAIRWENPIPVPEWVAPVQRAALGDDVREGGAR
jgi:hypothetical protein